MKKQGILLVLMLLLFSCAEKLIEKPDNVIPQDKMVLILKDLAIINAAKGTNLGKLRDNGVDPTTYVFEKYEVDSAQFVDSDRYYASLPIVYESIYKEVEASLENQRVQLEADKREMDSLDMLKKSPTSITPTATTDSI